MTQDVSELLGSEDYLNQLMGIERAVETESYFHLLQILKLLSSENKKVAGSAFKALMELTEKCLYPHHPPLPESVIVSAVKIKNKLDPDFVKKLDNNLRSGNHQKMIEALMALKYFVSRKRAQSLLHRFLTFPDKRIRATAVLHLGGVASRATLDSLSGYLDDNDNRVKANAIEVLEELNEKSFINVLARFRADANNRIRGNALKAMQTVGDIDISDDVRFMLMDPQPLMRASAVWVVGEVGARLPKLLDLLQIVKDDDDEMITRNLLTVLKKVGNRPELNFLDHLRGEESGMPPPRKVMESDHLEITRKAGLDYLKIELTGVLTEKTSEKAQDALYETIKNESRLVFDFTGIRYVDETGVSLLKNVNMFSKKEDGFLYIYGCSSYISELFQLSKVNTQLNLFNSLEDIENFIGVAPQSL